MTPHTSHVSVVGLSGGFCPTRPLSDSMRGAWWGPGDIHWRHDSAAVLVRDGRIVAGIEEERLNRIKHTNRLPRHAVNACLEIAGQTLDDVALIAYYSREDDLNRSVTRYALRSPGVRPFWSARQSLAAALSHDLETPVDPDRIVFVEHHLAHAASAYFVGPFSDALVVTLDGIGDGISGSVWAGNCGELRRLLDIPFRDSLGELYLRTIEYLGYAGFDEYKVMGLAPYGDPRRFRQIFDEICLLQPEGRFEVKLSELRRVGDVLGRPRRAGEPLTDVHQDLAAALQEAVERGAFHLFRHYRALTGLPHLCLAGGVAHNSTLVGKIARSGVFDGVFVQPAAHDAGCALGAALSAHHDLRPDVPIRRISDVYWGRPVGRGTDAGERLARWAEVVDLVRLPDPAAAAAGLLADGAVIGWVQGRAEFGPRALGNRSILADPRPARNKDRINELVKERESYRPFAPAVLDEHAGELFDMPSGTCGAFMTLTVPVKPHARSLLGAVTHVDGTARVQTVSRAVNERFWELLEAFRRLTGTPVLLNTSFNHSVEPIVDSIDDAVTCFLTTGLTHLIVDEYLVTKRNRPQSAIWYLAPEIPEYVRVMHAVEGDGSGGAQDVYQCEHLTRPLHTRRVSSAAYRLLERADAWRSLHDMVGSRITATEQATLAAELHDLWVRRLLRFVPMPSAGDKRPAIGDLTDTVMRR